MVLWERLPCVTRFPMARDKGNFFAVRFATAYGKSNEQAKRVTSGGKKVFAIFVCGAPI
jgi:hypothetical protein